MDKHQILTEEELAMLRDLGDTEDQAAGQCLSGNLSLSLQSLLQRAEPLILEAHIAGHQLRFPLSCTEAVEGHTELHIAAPLITELGYLHLRAWRLDEQASLLTADGEFGVHSLSVGGLIVEGLPMTLNKGDPLDGSLLIGGLPPLPLTGVLVREVVSHRPLHDWALQFQLGKEEQELLRDWLFQRHQDAFVQARHGD